jgi:hypothetical protein
LQAPPAHVLLDLLDLVAAGVMFNLPPLDSAVFFKLSTRGLEGVPQGHVDILMRLLVMMIAAYNDMLIGYSDVEPNLIKVPMVLVMMFGLDRNSAAGDVVAMLFKLGRFLTNPCFDCIRMGNPAKGDFKW